MSEELKTLHSLEKIKLGSRIVFIRNGFSNDEKKDKTVQKCLQHLSNLINKDKPPELTQVIRINSMENLKFFAPIYYRQQSIIRELKAKCEVMLKIQLIVIFSEVSKQMVKDNIFRDLVCNGRHFGITSILDLPHHSDHRMIDPTIRSQMDWCFVWQASNDEHNRELHEKWVGYFRSFDAYNKNFKDGSECLMVGSSPENSVAENVFYYDCEESSLKRRRTEEHQDSDTDDSDCCCCRRRKKLDRRSEIHTTL